MFRSGDPILFEIIESKNTKLLGLQGTVTLNHIRQGHSWGITSLTIDSYQTYVDRICEEFGYQVIAYPKKYKDKVTYITKDGIIWSTCLDCLTRGQGSPTDRTLSFGEACLLWLFKTNNINFIPHNIIHHMDGSWQHMDFYLPDYNMCVEYNGIQHYEETPFKNLKNNNANDLKKYRFCKEHNIKYCEIPYIYNSIESITEYVEKKILCKKLKKPDRKLIQYTKSRSKDDDIIKYYKKTRSATETGKHFDLSSVSIGNILRKNNIPIENINAHKLRPVVAINMDNNNLYNIYSSAATAARYFDKKAGAPITQACKKLKNNMYGYQWMYLDEYIKVNPLNIDYIQENMINDVKGRVIFDISNEIRWTETNI
jgi:hypothetical protein